MSDEIFPQVQCRTTCKSTYCIHKPKHEKTLGCNKGCLEALNSKCQIIESEVE